MVNSLSSVMVRPTMSWVKSCNLRHNLRHKEKNNKKITQAGGVGNQRFPLALSTFLWQNTQSSYLAQWARTINRKRFFGTKLLKYRKFCFCYFPTDTSIYDSCKFCNSRIGLEFSCFKDWQTQL